MTQSPKPAVGSIRMSHDQQQDSPAQRRQDIQASAQRQGNRSIRSYEDHGLTRNESSKRHEFQKLLAHANAGTFDAVLLSGRNRVSRASIFDAMHHWRLFGDADPE